MGCGRELGASSGVETAGILGWGKYQTYYSFFVYCSLFFSFYCIATSILPPSRYNVQSKKLAYHEDERGRVI
ncbi:uncharacterized protein CLUP02_12738 [Colletotrichum lupini]|uniref:Uncharacterized protein n=1 Tax=Colletotrichum lupini TaxID=145971 RepID=A0A9Q8T1T2_9PEZI|nr:uncharacterized protein CLUP02_12738 [Colletotrichum lupini]KAK1712505.1 hypothetical protein BDP67DRAFT_517490 [Colletotrichum lupini]UQC87235.1 hypothetical protein CLUP02_12738 [Colletotrichum lupini]